METTLFPVAALPTCVTRCGVLYDVNGACVPPGATKADAATYNRCFCADPRLAAFSQGPLGICDSACTENPNDLSSIQGWYTSFCAQATKAATSTARPQGQDGGTWLDNHYQWVIFLVIMVVAIVGIWIGACVWRKRYLRKKDRQYALSNGFAHTTSSGRIVPNASAGSVHVPTAGFFDPAPISSAAVYEKPPKAKKWVFRERT